MKLFFGSKLHVCSFYASLEEKLPRRVFSFRKIGRLRVVTSFPRSTTGDDMPAASSGFYSLRYLQYQDHDCLCLLQFLAYFLHYFIRIQVTLQAHREEKDILSRRGGSC